MFSTEARDAFFRFLQSGDISPSLADPALLSVVGVVDRQVAGFVTKERISSTEFPTSSEYTGIYYIEEISSLVTLSPTLEDPARVSVIRAVDGQDTGLSAQLAEKEELTSDRHRPGLSPSERTGPGFSAFKASANRPAQKYMTSDLIVSTKLVP